MIHGTLRTLALFIGINAVAALLMAGGALYVMWADAVGKIWTAVAG
jgi:hypothetical protein